MPGTGAVLPGGGSAAGRGQCCRAGAVAAAACLESTPMPGRSPAGQAPLPPAPASLVCCLAGGRAPASCGCVCCCQTAASCGRGILRLAAGPPLPAGPASPCRRAMLCHALPCCAAPCCAAPCCAGATMDPKVASELSLRIPHLALRMREHSARAQYFAGGRRICRNLPAAVTLWRPAPMAPAPLARRCRRHIGAFSNAAQNRLWCTAAVALHDPHSRLSALHPAPGHMGTSPKQTAPSCVVPHPVGICRAA